MRLFLAAGFLFTACMVEPPSPTVEATTLRIAGSRTVGDNLLPTLLPAFERSHPDWVIDVSSGSSTAGFRALLDGSADIAASSRPPTSAEIDQAKADGYDLAAAGSIIAVNVVGVSVHPSNFMESLTYDQVIGIFCTGEINNWSELGLDARPVRVLAVDPTHGERVLFEDFFCGAKGLGKHVEKGSWAEIATALQGDVGAISFGSMSQREGKLLALRPEPMSKPISPTRQNIIRGAYPLAHDMKLYTRGPAEGPAADLITFINSPGGQDLVDQAHFVPLFYRPPRMDDPRPLRETIHFEPGSATPTQRSMARLQMLTDELRDRAGAYNHIILEGYTDSEETSPEVLSIARAQQVRDMLTDAIPGLFVEIIPRGAEHPLAPNETAFGRQRNRRVQVYLAAEESNDAAEAIEAPLE